jgi:hypothetical protein
LDLEKIKEEEKYDGYYAISTNLDDDVRGIIAINEQRYQIEDCFRILKTDFASRPYFHQRRDRIIAHFMMCYTALLIYRLLENKLNKYDKSIHCTTRNIIETLRNMQVGNLEDVCYAAQYTGSNTLCALEGVFALGLVFFAIVNSPVLQKFFPRHRVGNFYGFPATFLLSFQWPSLASRILLL